MMATPSKYCRAKIKKKFKTSLVVQLLRLCPSNAGGVGSIPGWGTKVPHAAWHSQKERKKYTLKINRYNLSIKWEKAMAPHSSTLAWRIPWTGEPGRLQSTGKHRVRHY